MKRVEADISSLISSSYWFGSLSLALQSVLFCSTKLGFSEYHILILPRRLGFEVGFISASKELQPSFLIDVSEASTAAISSFEQALLALSKLSKCVISIKTKQGQKFELEMAFGKVVYLGCNRGNCLDVNDNSMLLKATNIFQNFPLRQRLLISKSGWESRLTLECLKIVQFFALLNIKPKINLAQYMLNKPNRALLKLRNLRKSIEASFELIYKSKYCWLQSNITEDNLNIQLSIGKNLHQSSATGHKLFIVNNRNCVFPRSALSCLQQNKKLEAKDQSIIFILTSYLSTLFQLSPPEEGVLWKVTVLKPKVWRQELLRAIVALQEKPSSVFNSGFSWFHTFMEPVKDLKISIDKKRFTVGNFNTEINIVKKQNEKVHNEKKDYMFNKVGSYTTEEISAIFNRGISEATFVSQIDNKFLSFTLSKEKYQVLLIFDQHGVHERIRKEEYIANYEPEVESVVVNFSVTKEEEYLFYQAEQYLKYLGYEMIILNSQVTIKQAPVLLKHNFVDKEDILSISTDYLQGLVSLSTDTIPKVILDRIDSKACRGAIKFGDKVSSRAAVEIFQKLGKCKFPFQCAHGRTTVAAFAIPPRIKSSIYSKILELPQVEVLQKCSLHEAIA